MSNQVVGTASVIGAFLVSVVIACSSGKSESQAQTTSGGTGGTGGVNGTSSPIGGGAGTVAGHAGASAGNSGLGQCDFAATYGPLTISVVEGSCDVPIAGSELGIRELPNGLGILFDDTEWEHVAVRSSDCSFTATTAELWSWNDAMRQRVLKASVKDAALDAEMTDIIDGTTSNGKKCNVLYHIQGKRSSQPPPKGAAVGADCGGLGCNASRCAIGGKPDCESGVCLFDTTVDPWDSICTAPCSETAPCPSGFICLKADLAFDTPEGSYCARYRPICGNKLLEAGEGCDDGNVVGGDGCARDCVVEGCGNQRIDANEDCDASVGTSTLPCKADCSYDLPPGVQAALPPQQVALDAFGVAALNGGQLLIAWMIEDANKVQHVWVRRLSGYGAVKDAPIEVASGKFRADTFKLAGTTNGALLLFLEEASTTQPARVFETDASGANIHETHPFSQTEVVLYPGGMTTADGANAVIFAPAFFPNVGSGIVALRGKLPNAFDVPIKYPFSLCTAEGMDAAFTSVGQLVLAWSKSCAPYPSYLSVIEPGSTSSEMSPVEVPLETGEIATLFVLKGTSTPTVVARRRSSSDSVYRGFAIGRYVAGSWTWKKASTEATTGEQLVGVAAAPDGSVTVFTYATSAETPPQHEFRFAREVSPGTLGTNPTVIAVSEVGSSFLSIDATGTVHVVYTSKQNSTDSSSSLLHMKVRTDGSHDSPERLWSSGVFEGARSPDGSYYLAERNSHILIHVHD